MSEGIRDCKKFGNSELFSCGKALICNWHLNMFVPLSEMQCAGLCIIVSFPTVAQ